MKMLDMKRNYISIIMLLTLNIDFFFMVKAEYLIHTDVVPSYLNYSFYNLSEEVFPADLTIIIHLSRVLGTLLYSVDSNNNQLIMSINDEFNPTLDIEFSKKHIYVSLAKLCNLEWAKYTNLSLRIQMREVIYLQCNDGPMDSYKYQRTHQLNKDYTIPRFNTTEKMQAKLWLVNTPHMDGIYPNNAQLSGCIFDVLYKKKSLKMETYRVENKCIKKCTNNICNSGQCLETYNKIPVCNCTSAFNNGDYCNKTLSRGKYPLKGVYQFKSFKITNKPNGDGAIFKLNKLHESMNLTVKRNQLNFIIECHSPYRTRIESTVTDNYFTNETHILIIAFNKMYLDVQLRSGNSSSWSRVVVPHFHDFSLEVFDSIYLNGELIDFSFKNDIKEIRWTSLLFPNPLASNTPTKKVTESVLHSMTTAQTNKYTTSSSFSNNKAYADRQIISNAGGGSSIFMGLIGLVLLIVIILVVVLLGVLIKMKRRLRLPGPAESESTPLTLRGPPESESIPLTRQMPTESESSASTVEAIPICQGPTDSKSSASTVEATPLHRMPPAYAV